MQRTLPGGNSTGKKKMPPDPEINNIRTAETHNQTMTLRRSYGMVVSSFENVALKGKLSADAAEQFGKTVDHRVRELNREAQKKIEEMPEYKNLGLDQLHDLGEELADLMTESDEYMKAFALLKNSAFAELMESTETIHRSFSDMMKDNGEERLMFGVFEMIQKMGGLADLQDSKQVSQESSRVSIRV